MSRSRSGCTTCKKRHRKCDETRPTCLACDAQGLECEGYDIILRWGSGIASRGHFAGASIPVVIESVPEPQSAALSSVAGVAVRGQDSIPAMLPTSLGTIPRSAQSIPGPTLPRRLLPLPQLAELEETQDYRLLHEFTKSTVFYLYSTYRDAPLAGNLLQLARESEALRAIIAAMHLYLTNSADPGPLFEEYSTRGMFLFRRQLDNYDGSLDAAVLWTGLFICTLNLFQGIPWSSLLQHMINVYELPRNIFGQNNQLPPAVSFTLEAMAVMDLPTFVRGRTARTLGIWANMRAAPVARSDDSTAAGIELLSGLPRTLLDIFAVIEDDSAEQKFLAWPGDVGDIPFCHLWEAYRIAGVLVGRRLRNSIREASGHSMRTPAVPPRGPTADVLVGRLIAVLDALCEVSGRASYSNILAVNSIFYPYVAARLEVAVLRRHGQWIDILRQVKRISRPYGDTENARVVEGMLDEAYDTFDDLYDIDAQARRREVETAMF